MLSKNIESPVLALKKKKTPDLMVLQRTITITKEHTDPHYQWEIIKKWYEDVESHPDAAWEDKAMTSIINSIVHQRRAYFGLTRKRTRELLKEDKNWKEPIDGMPNGKYSLLRGRLVEAGIVELVYDGSDKKEMSIYKVIDKNIMEMIKVDSAEEQKAQLLDYIGENRPDIHSDIETDIHSDTEKKRRREEENKAKPNQITIETLLFRQHPEDLPRFEDIPFLASLAVENVEDFDTGNYILNRVKKHFLSLCGSKPTKKQKDYVQSLVDQFEFEATKYCNLAKVDVQLKEPESLQDLAIKKPDIDQEAVVQNNTLNVLKSTFGGDKIRLLEKRLSNCDDEKEKDEIQRELNFWRKVL